MKRISAACAVLTMATAFVSHAAEVTPEQAQKAAENWIGANPQRMGAAFLSATSASTETVSNETGRAIFHAVNLEGGGFVITSGDTRLTPIIAFSATGRYSGDENSPMYTFLQQYLSGTVAEFERVDSEGAANGSPIAKSAGNPCAAAMAEWGALLADGRAYSKGEGEYTLSDVRVGPLIETQWGQDGGYSDHGYGDDYLPALDYYVYDPYVPYSEGRGNIPCGCVATAGAQLMYFWKRPNDYRAQFSNTCFLDGVPFTAYSISGTFDWENMFKTWIYSKDPDPTEVQRQAVGKLAWNICVATEMAWKRPTPETPGSGGTLAVILADQLKERFGYASATYIKYEIDTQNKPADFNQRIADFNNAFYASLDAKMPVILSFPGHTLLADGYGYMSGKRYAHLNFGWWSDGDAWYCMDEPIVSNISSPFTAISGIGFNVHPDISGDVISGRVLNSSAAPVAGATVTLYGSSGAAVTTSTTDAKGIYSLRVASSGSYTVKAVYGNQESPLKAVSIPSASAGWTYDEGCRTRNRWGNDLTVAKVALPSIVFNGNGGKFSNGAATKTVEAKPGNLWGKLPMPAKSGYVFDGYYTAQSGGTMITASSTVPSGNATYYARWTPRLGLAVASEWPYEFTTDSWCGQGSVAHDGTDALRSGIIYDGQSSYLQTKVTGAGTLSFWWAVSSESGNDALRFLVDGSQKYVISGDKDWTQVTVPITGTGTHTLKWNYTKNGSVTKGEDYGWLDQMKWTPSGYVEVVFDANGGKFSNGATTKKVANPKQGNLWGKLYMPSMSGQVFVGWYTAKSGGTLITSSTVVPTASTTYYAHWTPRLGLAAASEWSREFETDSWCGQGAVSHDGTDALRSGIIYDGQLSYLQTKVTGAGTLTFWCKVSSEGGGNDKFRFLVDGDQKFAFSGERDWEKIRITIGGSGTHTLKWVYSKNASVTKGEDFAWLDQLEWTPLDDITVTFRANGGTIGGVVANDRITVKMTPGDRWDDKLPWATYAHKVLVGWYSDPSDGYLVTASSREGDSDKTYYAHWEDECNLQYAAGIGIPGTFETLDGVAGWVGQKKVSHDGVGLRSGHISHGEESSLWMKVWGPGTLTFWWKVSSEENYDILRCFVDRDEKAGISGDQDWTKVTIQITGSGPHEVEWAYDKDSEVTMGRDCGWVDEIQWTGSYY